MYYLLTAVVTFLVTTLAVSAVWAFLYGSRQREFFRELAHSFGIQLDPDWSIQRERAFISKVLVRTAMDPKVRGACKDHQRHVYKKMERPNTTEEST